MSLKEKFSATPLASTFKLRSNIRMPITLRWDKRLNLLWGIIVLGLVYLPLRDWLLTVAPFATVVVSFSVFMLPGAALALYLLPEENWIERLPLAMALSGAVLSAPGIVVLALHLSLMDFIWGHVAVTGLAVGVITILTLRNGLRDRQGETETSHSNDRIPFLIILAMALGMAAIFVISLRMPLIGDDWVAMPWLWEFRSVEHVNLYSPYHGIDLPTTVRQEFAVLALLVSGINEISGLEPISFYNYLRPCMTILGILAFYSFMRRMLRSRKGGAVATSLWITILLAGLLIGRGGYDLVVRILQDKFFLRYVILPLALGFLIEYFRTNERRYIVLFGLVAWSSGTTHPIGPALIALPAASFGILHLLFTLASQKDRPDFWKQFWRLALAGGLLCVAMALPAMQLTGAEEGWVSFTLEGAIIDPNYLNRIRLATRAYRLLLLDDGGFTLHPAIILDPQKLVAMALMPILLFRMRKSLPARLFFATYFIVVPLLYIPQTAHLLGQVVTPWLLWRFAWALDIAAWAIITGAMFIVLEWIAQRLKRWSPHSGALIPAIGILTFLFALAPAIKNSYTFAYNLQINPDQSGCLAPGVVLKRLAGQVNTDTIILTSQSMDFCVPAYSAWTNVIEYRGVSTLTRFPTERREEAWQRLMDSEYFTAARYVDDRLNDIIDRYQAEYLLVEQDRILNLQLAHMPTWFKLIDQAGGYDLYEIMPDRPASLIASANDAMTKGDWRKAEPLYRQALFGSRDDKFLAYLGLARVERYRGNIQGTLEYTQQAVDLQPGEAIAHALLGDTYILTNNLEEARAEYETALSILPTSGYLMLRLGDAYRLEGNLEKARDLYHRTVLTRAPDKTPLYYMVIGQVYNHAGWYNEAIAAFQTVVEQLPIVLEPRVAIGSAYLTQNNLDLAEAAFQDAYNLDSWNASPRLGLGQVAAQRGDSNRAIELYLEAIRFDPATNVGYNLFLNEYYDTHSTQETIAEVKSLIGFKLSMPGALDAMADLYVRADWFDEAMNLYNQAIAADPLSIVNYLTDIAADLNLTGKYREAIDMYRYAQSMGEMPVAAYTGLGSVFQIRAMFDEAMGQYYGAVLLDPFSASTHVALGNGYRNMFADWEKAVREYEFAIQEEPTSPLGYLSLADVYHDMGRFDDSIEVYQKAIQLNPYAPDGYLGLAQVYQDLGQPHEALAILTKADALTPSLNKPAASMVWVALGNHYHLQKDLTKAIEYFRRAVDAQPNQIELYIGLSDAQVAAGDNQAAMETLQEGIRNTPGDFTGYRKLADLALISDHPEDALSWLEKGVAANPTLGYGYAQVAEEYRRRGDLNRAIEVFHQALQVQPDSTDAYMGLANLYRTAGQDQAAEAVYKDAIQVIPDNNSFYAGLGDIYLRQGKLAQAEAAYRQAVQLLPSANAYLTLSNIVRIQRGWPAAAQVLEEGTRARPALVDTYLNLGNFYLQWGYADKAAEAYTYALVVDPLNPGAYLGLSQTFRSLGDTDTALNILETSRVRNRNASQAYLNLASFYESRGDTSSAEGYFQKGLDLSPTNNATHLTVAQFYQRQKRYPEALAILQKALTIPPNNSALYVAIGNTYLSLNQPDEALRWYREATTLNSTDISAYQSLSTFYQSRENWNAALDALYSGLSIQPNNVYLRLSLGYLYQRLNRLAEARQQFEIVCAQDQLQVDCQSALARLDQQAGKWSSAAAHLEKAITNSPTNLSLYTQLGQMYRAANLLTQAENAYTRGYRNSYDKAGALVARAGFYVSLGQWEKARSDYEAALQFRPKDQTIGAQVAMFYNQRGEWAKSIEILKALSLQPDATASNLTTLANLYVSSGQWYEAVRGYKKAIQIDKTYLSAYVGLANVYQNTGRRGDVLSVYQQATLAAPNDPLSYVNLGDAFLSQQYFSAAENAYRKALAIDPLNTTAFIRLDNLSLKMGKGGNDLTPLVNRVEAAPAYYLYTTLAIQYQLHAEWDKALSYLQKAVAIDPYNASVWNTLGSFYRAQQELELAQEAFDKALQFQPYSSSVLQSVGYIQYSLGQTEESITTLNKAIESDRSVDTAYVTLANFQYSLEDTEAAIETLESGLDAKPSSEAIFQSLSQMYIKMGDYDQALATNQRGLSLMPGSSTLTYNQGNILESIVTQVKGGLETNEAAFLMADYKLAQAVDIKKQNNNRPWTVRLFKTRQTEYWDAWNKYQWAVASYERAGPELESSRQAYLKAVRMQGDNVYALLGLARLAAIIDDKDTALAYYLEAVAKNPTSPTSLNALAKYYLDLGRPEDALATYRLSLTYSPNNSGTLFGLTRVYSELGDIDALSSVRVLEYSQVWWKYYMDLLRR